METIPNKCKVKNVSTLYHISTRRFDNKTLKPRVPRSISPGEDEETKRVCFSTSMTGCYRAACYCSYFTFYVHVLTNKDELLKNKQIVKPTTDMVWDQKLTHEYWSVGDSQLRCIGKALFIEDNNHIRIKWIKKYI